VKHLLLTALWLTIFTSCSWLPKVTIIDDPLTKEEHFQLALAYEKDGDLELAEREYRFALPLAAAYLGLGNVSFQNGKPQDAKNFYLKALDAQILPAAANNLAWLMLIEGDSLYEAKKWATAAVEQAQKNAASTKEIEGYQSTLNQIIAAIEAQNSAQ
jgi:tetratricopeptide (TPR) repeat protein